MSDLLSKVLGPERVAEMLRDPAKFAAAFDREPWVHQAADMRAVVERVDGLYRYRFCVISVPRQDGKTTTCAWLALCLALCDPNVHAVVAVALDREGAKVLLNDVRHIILGSEMLMNLVDPDWGLTRSNIRFVDGTELLIKSADAKMSRGLRPGVVVYDEMGWASDDGDLFQTLSAAQGAQANPLFIVASTVGPIQYGPLWDLFERARQDDPSVLLIYRNENLSPLVTGKYLEEQRRMLPSSVYAREHENIWSGGVDTFCSYEAWETATSGGNSILPKFPGPSFMYIDLGIISDETAIAVSAKGDERVEIIALDAMRGKKGKPLSFDRIKQRVEQMVGRLGVTQIKIESPQGYAMAQELAYELKGVSVEIVHPTQKVQNKLWGYFHGALKDGLIHIPKEKILRRQLLSLTIKQSLTGWRVVDVPSIHQDRAIAVGGAALMASAGDTFFEYLRQEGYGPQDDVDPEAEPEPEPEEFDELFVRQTLDGPVVAGGSSEERANAASGVIRD